MITTTYSVRILQPSEGFTLTQNKEVDIKERIFSNAVYLAKTDTPSSWKEITNEVAEVLKEEQRIAFEKEEEELRRKRELE